MLKILFDHNFNHDIRRGLIFRIPELDCVTAYEIGLSSAHDRNLLRWAASNGRLTITHDRRTMPDHFASLLTLGEHTAGILIVPQNMRVRRAIDELERFVVKSGHVEWENRIHII